ncbi:MAG: hypothetical protein HUJ84_06805 [Veillonella sp.]|nr:hypothetical protein [Veillonella sp.]
MAEKKTPMMEQYDAIKERYPDTILFFRLGDFYEMFNEDAHICSRELDLTLTGRTGMDANGKPKAPMCGIPYHAYESYLDKLVKKGYKVAICEQMEDPKQVKGIVKRDVIRVVTPGTIMSESGNDARSNNFLSLIHMNGDAWTLVFADISTGEVIWDRIDRIEERKTDVYDALSMYRPTEIVVAEDKELPQDVADFVANHFEHTVVSSYDAMTDLNRLASQAASHFADMGLMEEDVLEALGYLLHYLTVTIKTEASHINYVHRMSVGNRMILDTASLRHLEITHNLRDGGQKGTLLSVLDRTLTPMGARLLKQWLESPLTDIAMIQRRQAAISECISRSG